MLKRALVISLLGALSLAQAKPAREGSATMSDREKSGLRGPVKSCTEEHTWPNAAASSAGPAEFRSESTTEYDPGGLILSTRNGTSQGSGWVRQYHYSPSGRLLNIASGKEDGALTETVYSYDSLGRLQTVTDQGGTRSPTIFQYDEHGRKTAIETSRPEDYRPNVATGGGPFASLGGPPNLPGGGSATTFFDDQDRPTEIQLRNGKGVLVSRAVRSYDVQGRILEEKQTVENMTSMFPPEARAKLLEQSGLSEEQFEQEIQAQIRQLMGAQSCYTVSYQYDSHGRAIHTSGRTFNHRDETETTYNQYGDIESEITTTTRPAAEDGAPPSNSYSEARHFYVYDQHGNWIEQRNSYRSSPDGPLQPSGMTKRTLTYYENE